jgi:hypothetical protein
VAERDSAPEATALAQALREIAAIAPPCSDEAAALPIRAGEGGGWWSKLRDAQRIAIAALRASGRDV